MKRAKINLEQIKVDSFVTTLSTSETNTVDGGSTPIIVPIVVISVLACPTIRKASAPQPAPPAPQPPEPVTFESQAEMGCTQPIYYM